MIQVKSLLLILSLVGIPSVALADQWIPYTDGRAGGCFLNGAGVLYGCTPSPVFIPQPKSRSPYIEDRGRVMFRNRGPSQLEIESAAERLLAEREADDLAIEVEMLEAEVRIMEEALRLRQIARDKRKFERWLNMPPPECKEWLAKQNLVVYQSNLCRFSDGSGAMNCPPCPENP